MEKFDIKVIVRKYVTNTKVIDIHTHLFPADFGELTLWGPDELITLHYLVAEPVRATHSDYDKF